MINDQFTINLQWFNFQIFLIENWKFIENCELKIVN